MKIKRMDHVGIIVNDLPAATAFFLDLGLEVLGEAGFEGEWLDEVVGLRGVKTEFVMLGTPEGGTGLELIKYLQPEDEAGIQRSQSNTLGIRHLAFPVDDIEAVVARLKEKGVETFSPIYQYEDMYKLLYVRGPEGIILELAQELK
jgi:catechol 2,3-dioxygenase-like lactoylglutathione lyase family enzyme